MVWDLLEFVVVVVVVVVLVLFWRGVSAVLSFQEINGVCLFVFLCAHKSL